MGSLPTAILDHAFADEVAEVVTSCLLGYQPILDPTVLLRFQSDLELIVERGVRLESLRDRGITPIPLAAPLTPGQVSLLGGTRPTRTVHAVERRLDMPAGGDRREENAMAPLLHASGEALESVAVHYVVPPIRSPEDRVKELRAFVEVGIAAQFAALMGALEESRWLGRPEEELARSARHFHGAVQAFLRIELSRSDQAVFKDYYRDDGDIEEIADERNHQLPAEAKRRLAFLQRFAKALRAATLLHADPRGAGSPVAALADGDARAPAPPLLIEAATEEGEGKARLPVRRATSPAARPRKR